MNLSTTPSQLAPSCKKTERAPSSLFVQSGTSYSGGGTIYSAAYDINSDGVMDLISSENGSGNIQTRTGLGSGSFSGSTNTYAVGGDLRYFAIGNLNNDSFPDLVSIENAAPTVNIRMNNGSGLFGSNTSLVEPGSSGTHVLITDMNKDGFNDIVSVNYLSSTVVVRLNSGIGTFPSSNSYTTGAASFPNVVQSTDLNNDGYPDLITANLFSNTVSVILNNGAGALIAPVQYPVGTMPQNLVIADFNKDGRVDFATSNYSSNNTTIYFGSGGTAFGSSVNYTFGSGGGTYWIDSGDFNCDGYPDLVTANYLDNSISIRMNQGNGVMGAETQIPVTGASVIRSVFVGDLNQDGYPDVLASGSASATTHVFLNQGL